MNKAINKSHPVLMRYRLTRLLFWSSLVLYLIHTPVVMAQPDNDPIPPPLASEDSSKTIVVNLDFQNGIVTGSSTEVVFGHAPARIGNPPLLRIDLFNFRGALLEQFDAWHPLWTFVTDDTGAEHLIISTEATGNIAFPFVSDYKTMKVIDVEQGQELISVNLLPTIRDFCKGNILDPDCQALDTIPPVITVSASPATLWPPNGKMVPVTISGRIVDPQSGINTNTATYAVTDEYGQVQSKGSVALRPDGSYTFTIQLQASRRGDDKNGRQYINTISAQDNAENNGTASTMVIVLHDQGK